VLVPNFYGLGLSVPPRTSLKLEVNVSDPLLVKCALNWCFTYFLRAPAFASIDGSKRWHSPGKRKQTKKPNEWSMFCAAFQLFKDMLGVNYHVEHANEWNL